MARNIYGGGARTNEFGLKFEQETSLEKALINAGYTISEEGIVYNENGEIGIIAPKHLFYQRILEPRNINWRDYISKRLLPDEAFLNFNNKTVYIIEKKFQHTSGSVDEKLQTCDFKKKQYQRLLKQLDCHVEYLYVCNGWFNKESYNDVHEYIRSSGCYLFFDEIPLDFLGLI